AETRATRSCPVEESRPRVDVNLWRHEVERNRRHKGDVIVADLAPLRPSETTIGTPEHCSTRVYLVRSCIEPPPVCGCGQDPDVATNERNPASVSIRVEDSVANRQSGRRT